ncbi:unannotated protein [freshwater metagenome]|uniref:Unannotated protein n=1 Tax=freshwater metagenome TaxID=449393 RepID=A0A6J5YNQ4_9ZZZZ
MHPPVSPSPVRAVASNSTTVEVSETAIIDSLMGLHSNVCDVNLMINVLIA